MLALNQEACLKALLEGVEETCIRIPMVDEARSLNLSNAVSLLPMKLWST